MDNCKGCIYRTTVEITKWHQRYSTIHEKEIENQPVVLILATLLEEGRVSCKEFKSE